MAMFEVPAGFTLNDLLTYLRTGADVPNGMTAREWATHFDVGSEKMKRILRQAHDQGVLQVARSTRVAIDGIQRQVPVYRFDLGDVSQDKDD